MTSFFGRIVERARAPIGGLRAPAGVPPLELESDAEEPSLEAATSTVEPVSHAGVEPATPGTTTEARAAAVEPTTARAPEPPVPGAPPAVARHVPAASPFRNAGVRSVATELPRTPPVAEPRLSRAAVVEHAPVSHAEGFAAPVLDVTATPAVTPEVERRWLELGQRLLHAHPPELAAPETPPTTPRHARAAAPPASPFEEAPRAAAEPSVPRADALEVMGPRHASSALPEAPFVAARPEPRVASPVARTEEGSRDATSDVVIQNLEVTVAAPRTEPEPARPRPPSAQRGGAWNVAARRYLTRI